MKDQERFKKIAEKMNIVLANSYALYLKTQNYHWNVKGPNFYSLHLLLENQYEEQAEAVDDIAERIRSLGHKVEASFAYFNKNSTLEEPSRELSAHEMLQDLIEGHLHVIGSFRELSDLAIENEDKAIEDFSIGRILAHEKQRWMLMSSAG